MEYNYTSRSQLYQNFYDKNMPRGLLFGEENKKIFEILTAPKHTFQWNEIDQYAGKMRGSGMEPASYLRKHHGKLVAFCTTKEYEEDFYAIIKKYNQFPYSRGMGRRTVRTRDYGPSSGDFFQILGSYYRLQFYGTDIAGYLENRLPEELLDFKQNMGYYQNLTYLDDMIAAALDGGNERLGQTVRDMILGENNTTAVSVPLIRGIIKSSDAAMHKLLGDFLLAARLQEGVRQAVCENMDCGTEAAFCSLFQVIYENNLIRYSSVKRAVGTWIGLMDTDHTDRIMGKILETMNRCLFTEGEKQSCTQSQDAIEIMVGLWCLGSHEVFDATGVMGSFLKEGTRQQKLVTSYYNRGISFAKFSGEIARRAMESHPEDMEMVAAFFPTYLEDYDMVASRAIERAWVGTEEAITVNPLHWNHYFSSETEADSHFQIMRGVLSRLTEKKKTYAPFLFPWYRVELTRSEIIAVLCLIAYMLKDDSKKDFAAELLPQIDAAHRGNYTTLLLHEAKTSIQKDCLLQALADRESYTRKRAFQFLKDQSFSEADYRKLVEMLRFKNHEIRQNILYLLRKREDSGLQRTLKELLEDKREEMRLAGLDLVLQLQKEEGRQAVYETSCPIALAISEPTERELVLMGQLGGTREKDRQEGFGLYSEKDLPSIGPVPYEEGDYPLFSISHKELKDLFAKLDAFIHSHREERATDHRGEEHILGNCKESLPRLLPWDKGGTPEQETPFFSLWQEFYLTHVKDFPTLYAMFASILPGFTDGQYEGDGAWQAYNRRLLGDGVAQMDISGYQYGSRWKKSASELFYRILSSLVKAHRDAVYCREIGRKTCVFLTHGVKESHRWLKQRQVKGTMVYGKARANYASQSVILALAGPLKDGWNTEEEWKERFLYLHEVDRAYDFDGLEQKPDYSFYYGNSNTWLSPFDYMKAYHLGIITASQMYYTLFEANDLCSTLNNLNDLISGKRYAYIKKSLERFQLLSEGENFDREFYDLVLGVSDAITDAILDIELKRGDTPTEVSRYVRYLPVVLGGERLKQLLVALGTDKLVRVNYSDTESKAGSLSCLLRKSRPAEGETAGDLAEILKGTAITRKRLIETGMFASDWMDLLEEITEMPGLKSGTYYFMAHMDDSFDEKKAAMIAKYTPLSKEELREGAFDINWFRDVQEKLGEEQLALLYDAAKYISYGGKHTRARKYADAAMGRLTPEAVKDEIKKNRNKDLLMALGLMPFQGKEDMLSRYEFIRAFRKESKEFGSMRRASEEHAADMALKNMALAAGYGDVTRLTLVMEAELTENIRDFFEWQDTGEGYLVRLEWREEGKADLLCQKGDKTLKSLPAALKKNQLVLTLKENQKKLKDQYRRTVLMLEKAMENRDAYNLSELKKLLESPVTGPIVQNLIFTGREGTKGACGFVTEKGFTDREGKVISREEGLLLYVAHPQDLYASGDWPELQRLFFRRKAEEKRTQPFRQVFRELYVKLEEEKKALSSKMFAGNQIQPARAAACLKGRGWIADYEEGLQKVYYKDNVVARIYALADWFSPSDVEAPTLEWVEFSDRKTFRSIPIGEVPDILYSEVMRDVDLAVSVAHAGSVDPETSHSTIEMRRVIVACNMELFGLTNVRVEGSHAMIVGKRAEYNIHLGSGIIHKVGGHQINVLPVPSQSRGRIFLPFVDEDPKTAEIVSKILLFAQDNKIKDPYILDQM